MARTRFTISTEAEIAFTAATAKTALQLVSPANIGVAVRGIGVSFDGTSGSAEPGLVRVLMQTTAGTMSAATPVHDDRRNPLTIQSTAQKTATVEPTASTVLRNFHMHPQTGVEFRFWLDEEIVLGGTSAQRLGIEVTMPATVNGIVTLYCEE
jgi:hypothetical protein